MMSEHVNEDVGEDTREPDQEMRRPDGLPLKFWDDTAKNVRVDAMIKSYGDLERKLGSQPVVDIPDRPDDYDIATDDLSVEADSDINARLHQAGFSREQANLVYQLANEKLAPLLASMAEDHEADAQIEQLQTDFGGAERWLEASRQIKSWGQANLSADVFEALTTSRDGVLTLHRMMKTGEPGIGASTGRPGGEGDQSVKALMNSPRYWRDRDPATVEKVRQEFRKLYPEGES